MTQSEIKIEKLQKEIKAMKERDEFIKLMRPVIKYLCEKHNPHTTIIVTPTNAELVMGEISTGEINDYVVD